jgi:hypothetical protein
MGIQKEIINLEKNMDSFTKTIVYKIETCCTCGMSFAISEDFRNMRLEDRKTFYCPSGHGQHYSGKSDAEKLKEQLEQTRNELLSKRVQTKKLENLLRIEEEYKKEYREQRDELKKSLSATKGHTTRLKKRIANGVCPCCKRTFKNLGAHMKSEHSDFVDNE